MDTVEVTQFETTLATSGLEAEGQIVIREALSPFYQQAADWQAKVALVTEPTVARASRLLLKKIRVEAGHKRAELKAGLLTRTRAIDAAFKTIEDTIAPMEATLDAIEKAAERAEALRIANLKADRDAQLLALGMSPTFFSTGQMPEEAFQGLLVQARAAHESRIAQAAAAEAKRLADIEAAKVAAAEKAKADEEERARVAAEHERLRKEAEANRLARIEADRIAAEERAAAAKARAEAEAKAKAERDAIEAKARKDREAAAAKLKAEREAAAAAKFEADLKAAKEREAAAAKLKAEREAREKLEREAAAARKAEADRLAAAQRERDRLAAAPDAEKLQAWWRACPATPLPLLTSKKGVTAAEAISDAYLIYATAVHRAIVTLES